MKHFKGSFVFLFLVFLFSVYIFESAIEAKEKVTAKVTTSGGIHVAEFTTPQGKIYLNLPDDMAGGDIISGKLTLEPSGLNEKKKTKNLESLEKYTLDVGGQKTPPGSRWGKWNIPAVKDLSIILRNPKGKVIASTRTAVSRETPAPGSGTFGCDKAGLAGSIIPIRGNFNGDFSDTDIRIGERELIKWAESPRRVLVKTPEDVIGLTTLSLKEGDFRDQCPYRNLSLQSQIGKDTLLKGEKTQLVFTVGGLDGLDEPLPLQIENKTPGIISMKQEETVIIHPGDVKPGGVYVCERTLTGITPGRFHITVVLVTERDCKKILKIYNAVKDQFDKQDKDCRKLAALVDDLKRKQRDAQQKRDKWKKELEDKADEIKKTKDALENAKQKLKDLVNFAIHSNEISTEPKAGLENSIGLYRGEVRIYFTGSQTSIDILSWFLNSYRDKWNKRRDECRKAARELKNLQKEKKKTEKELEKAENELKKVEEELKDAQQRLKDCLKGKEALDRKLKAMWEKYNRCLKRLEAQRECKSKMDDADGAVNGAGPAIGDAEKAIDGAGDEAGGLKKPSQTANDAIDQAKKLLEEAKELESKAQAAAEEAKTAFDNGDLEKAGKLANDAKTLAEQAKNKADEAKKKAEEARTEIKNAKSEEERIAQEERELERQEKEREQQEKEWWDEFLTEDNPTPHDIRGGKKNLAIGLRDLLEEYIMGQIGTLNFGGNSCKDRCLIAVRNTFGEQWTEVLKDLAWDVFWGSIQLPATITRTAVRLSFGVFKTVVGTLVKSNNAIPLWGKYTYEHPVHSFKGISTGKFKCEIESCLVYNKETGYVMGMVMCNCCNKVTTLYIKYKCNEYGRPLDKPAPRIEFR